MKVKILDHTAWIFDPITGDPIKPIKENLVTFNAKRPVQAVREIEIEEEK